MTPSEKRSEARRAALAQEIFGRRVLHRAQQLAARERRIDLGNAGHTRRAEIDDLHRAGGVDHHVLRPQVLVQHLEPMERVRPFAICSMMPRTVSTRGFGLSMSHG